MSDNHANYFVFDGNHVIEEYINENLTIPRNGTRLLAQYVREDTLDTICQIAVREKIGNVGREHWYHKDLVRSSRMLTDPVGQVSAHYRYLPFGILSEQDGPHNPLRFMGRIFDERTGTYDFRTRNYSPVLGRFLQSQILLLIVRILHIRQILYNIYSPQIHHI
jgi:RHS repeat-associated protein